jgi:hypothetical protein
VCGLGVEGLADRQQSAQLRHGLRVIGHRTAVALVHDAIPVVLGPGAEPDGDRPVAEASVGFRGGDETPPGGDHEGPALGQEVLE